MGESNQLLLDALQRAAGEPAGLPLFGGKKPLFAASAPARKTAQLCKDDGLLRVIRTESKGRGTQEICTITEKGLALLLEQVNPKNVLESLVRTFDARQNQLGEIVEAARRANAEIHALKDTAENVLQQLRQQPARALLPGDTVGRNGNGCESGSTAILAQMSRWHASAALGDCPLPQLYRNVCASAPAMTVGQFHDALRRLQEYGQVYLHPWTGPLYEIPEPVFALMVGHEIAYYASLRISP